ncbi:MAG: VOC family protein [Rhodocyclaceae bacterium]|nr:VOC family protein [Rhodocyclaceae bacterium]
MDAIHHIALPTRDVSVAVAWYRERFDCLVEYQDESWALLRFANVSLALVLPGQHPPHIGFAHADAARFGPLRTHRDGSRSTYIADPGGNAVEILDQSSLEPDSSMEPQSA